MSGTQIGRSEVGDRWHSDIVGHHPGGVGTQSIHDGKQIRVVGLGSVNSDWEAGEELLRATVMARAGMGQRAQKRELLGNARVLRQKLGDLQARNAGCNRAIRTTVLRRSLWLGIIGLQMARPAMEPHNE